MGLRASHHAPTNYKLSAAHNGPSCPGINTQPVFTLLPLITHSTHMASDTTLCKGSNLGDGCNGEFPNKTTPGLCQKCALLEKAGDDDAAKDKFESYPQCIDCGAAAKNIRNDMCSSCGRKNAAQASQTTASQIKDAAVAARSNAFPARQLSQRQSQPVPTQSRTNSSQPRSAKGIRQITLSIEALHAVKTTIHPVSWLGAHSRSFPETTMFDDALDSLVQAFNVSWDGRCVASLTRQDVTIRFHSNLNFYVNSDCGTVGEFYDTHFRLHNSASFLRMPTKFKGTASPALALGLFIELEWFRNNHPDVTPPALMDVPKKNTKRRISDSAEESAPKRPAISRPFTSTFVPPPTAPIRPSSVVQLSIHAFNEHGREVFPWPGGDGVHETTVEGRLYNDVLYKGRDRLVYELEIDGVTYLAKRSLDVPTDLASFTSHLKNLKATHHLLYRLSLALEEFNNMAEDCGMTAEVHSGFEVQPTFL
ncbi:hypothetical protein FB45DRAFT_1058160 [Roridomyces roridus]|nr:hypothetical protein FB45DRAFT_1058160 [Roridomyces roridus]